MSRNLNQVRSERCECLRERQSLQRVTGSAKALRLKRTWRIQGTARTMLCLKKTKCGRVADESERQEMKSEVAGGRRANLARLQKLRILDFTTNDSGASGKLAAVVCLF